MVKLLADLSYMTSRLDFTLCPDPGSMTHLGCDSLTLGVSLHYKGNIEPTRATIEATFSEEFPNLPPVLTGTPGFDEVPLGGEVEVQPFTLTEPDGDVVLLIVETTALIRISALRAPARKADSLKFETPEYVPMYEAGDFNVWAKKIQVRCTIEQANLALRSLYFKAESLGTHNLTIAVDDEGRTGYPALGPSWKVALKFSMVIKPELKPPTARVINTDESWRFDWRPGVRYLKGGTEVGIKDDLFPCGGDTVFGLFYFPYNSTPPDTPGWRGELPPGDGSESKLKRNCKTYPDTFWKQGEKALYATLDEGGKARVFVQIATKPSGCNETEVYKVTLAITNANNSRVNIPVAKVDGYHMDWFECRDGGWYCKNRHPFVTLSNVGGARDRLKFHYDQVHRHLSNGTQDYRMTFTGTHKDISAALRYARLLRISFIFKSTSSHILKYALS